MARSAHYLSVMRRNSDTWHNADKQLSSKDNQMPDKYSSVWPALVEAINTHGLAGLMAFVLGYLRIIYDDRESRPMRQFIEALLGACITVVVGLTAEHFGMSGGWAYACAGFTGVLGVNQVRQLAQRWANGKVGACDDGSKK